MTNLHLFKIVIVGILVFISINVFSQESNLKLSELNIGLDSRTSTYKILIPSTLTYSNQNFHQHWNGISARIQSSFLAEYILKSNQKKLKWGDIIAGEIGLGWLNSDSTGNSARFTYRFDFGFGFTHLLNIQNEWGINFLILKFTNDGTIPNGSGSSITLRYRYKNIIIEPNLDAHRQRIIGWMVGLNPKLGIALQSGIAIKYNLKNNHQLGLRFESMPFTGIKYIDYNQESQTRYAMRLHYGIIF